MDPANMLWVCRISGHCFDNLLSQAEAESDAVSEIFSTLQLLIVILQVCIKLYLIHHHSSWNCRIHMMN